MDRMSLKDILSTTIVEHKITTSEICVIRSNFEIKEIEISDILETIKLLFKYIKKQRKTKKNKSYNRIFYSISTTNGAWSLSTKVGVGIWLLCCVSVSFRILKDFTDDSSGFEIKI